MSFNDNVVVLRFLRTFERNFSLSNQLDNIFYSNSNYLEQTLYYSDEHIDYFEQILDPFERRRIPINSHRKCIFILSHGILRYFLARHLCISPNLVVYSYNNYGKPFIKSSNIQFSLSRRENYLAFFFSAVNCGIDIEISRSLDFIGISKLFFNTMEINQVEKQCSVSAAQDSFFKIWVKKEAMIKSLGCNLEYLKDADTINNEITINGIKQHLNLLGYSSSFSNIYIATSKS